MPGFYASGPPPLFKRGFKTLPKIGLAGNGSFVVSEPVCSSALQREEGGKQNTCSAFQFTLDPSGSEQKQLLNFMSSRVSYVVHFPNPPDVGRR